MSIVFDLARAAGETGSSESTDLRVVILYDKPASAHRAMSVVDGLASEFKDELRLHCDVWSFGVLRLTDVAAEASAGATNAQLIVVAADGDEPLPVDVTAWLEQWSVASVPGESAIVAVLSKRSESRSEPSAAFRFLEALAKHAGQEFFAREFRLPAPMPRWDVTAIQRRATEPSSILLGILEHSQPVRRWGLNE